MSSINRSVSLSAILATALVVLLLPHAGFAEDASKDAPFPAELPFFKVLDADGVAVPASRFKDKVVLIDFWASWCRPCLFTLPELESLHEEYGSRDDFAVVGFTIDEGRAGGLRARKFADENGVTYDIYHDFSSKPAKPQFRIDAVPVLFLVDHGKVVKRWDGEPDFSEVEDEIRKLLDLKPLGEEGEE